MDWNQKYAARDTPWEKGAPAPPLVEWLQTRQLLGGNVLVPGCGYGHDARAIASADSMAKVIGLDISPLAIERADAFPKVGAESYRLGDLFNLPEELLGKFDWAFEHTCFCAINPDRRSGYVRAIADSLAPRGFLLAIFYLNPWDPGDEPPEGGPPFPVSTAELDQLFGVAFDKVAEMNPRSAFPGREGREVVWLLRKK